MRGKREDFPVTTVDEVRFQQADVESIKKESLRPDMVDVFFCSDPGCSSDVHL